MTDAIEEIEPERRRRRTPSEELKMLRYEAPLMKPTVRVGDQGMYKLNEETNEEHFVAASTDLVGDDSGWQLLEELYERRGPDVVIRYSGTNTAIDFMYEGQWCQFVEANWTRARALRLILGWLQDSI